MFIKDYNGNLVNLDLVQDVGLSEPNKINQAKVTAYFNHDILHDKSKEGRREKAYLYFGDYEKCQAYMTELEKELKAYGKLISVEVKPETKCTCGNDGKPIWEHAENCAVYVPF